jgi:hypothetical protein
LAGYKPGFPIKELTDLPNQQRVAAATLFLTKMKVSDCDRTTQNLSKHIIKNSMIVPIKAYTAMKKKGPNGNSGPVCLL